VTGVCLSIGQSRDCIHQSIPGCLIDSNIEACFSFIEEQARQASKAFSLESTAAAVLVRYRRLLAEQGEDATLELAQLLWLQPVQRPTDRGIGGHHLASAAEILY